MGNKFCCSVNRNASDEYLFYCSQQPQSFNRSDSDTIKNEYNHLPADSGGLVRSAKANSEVPHFDNRFTFGAPEGYFAGGNGEQ